MQGSLPLIRRKGHSFMYGPVPHTSLQQHPSRGQEGNASPHSDIVHRLGEMVAIRKRVLLASIFLSSCIWAQPQQGLATAPAPGNRAPVPWSTSVSSWVPKTNASSYDASNKDWASVISACRQVGAQERRFFNKFIRAAFHDGMAVDISTCSNNCVAADASVILNTDEMVRVENLDFGKAIRFPLLKIASFYDISAADAMAVCGAVAIEETSDGQVQVISKDGGKSFPVGRLDSSGASTANSLPDPFVSNDDLYAWWAARGFTALEAMALHGTHALDPKQACLRPSGASKCDTAMEPCLDVRMWKLKNHWFTDLMTPTISLVNTDPDKLPAIASMTPAQYTAYRKEEMCKFSSKMFRDMRLAAIDVARRGGNDSSLDVPSMTVWRRGSCASAPATCPYSTKWYYTNSDAQLGIAAQSAGATSNQATIDIKAAIQQFTNQAAWYSVLPGAYIKMTSRFAAWSGGKATLISGKECPSKFNADACRKPAANPELCKLCTADGLNCPSCCRCSTAVTNGAATRPPPPPGGGRFRN